MFTSCSSLVQFFADPNSNTYFEFLTVTHTCYVCQIKNKTVISFSRYVQRRPSKNYEKVLNRIFVNVDFFYDDMHYLQSHRSVLKFAKLLTTIAVKFTRTQKVQIVENNKPNMYLISLMELNNT